eukprot:gb/GEZN01017961.1/.p1 GENE.gb/GEZN01017961.1/~~gb/GEZN01017961.1/.p1  ORF type:complete len:178 (-),score=6.32 gb/GEZN01017961.1/:227-760(-)
MALHEDGLSLVFRVQSWFSLFLGAALLMFPGTLFQYIGIHTPLIAPFKLTLQSWACFVLALSMIVHVSVEVPVEFRRSIGYCLLFSFGLLTFVYGQCLYRNGLSQWSGNLDEYRIPIAATGACFASLFLSYFFVLWCSKYPRPPTTTRLSTQGNGVSYKTVIEWEELDHNPYLGMKV